MYDVVIVGGGPSGLVSGMFSAETGANTLIVDRKVEIGTPVRCAEGVGRDPLERIGIKPKERWIASKIEGIRLVSPGGIEITAKGSKVLKGKAGYVLERKEFEKYLAEMAIRNGAEIRLRTTVLGAKRENGFVNLKMKCGGRVYYEKARIVIAADGIESRIARELGLPTTLKLKDTESGAQYEMYFEAEDPSLLYFYFGSEIAPGGYAWIFPKGESTANVGIGILQVLSKGRVLDYLDKFLELIGADKRKVIEINVGGIPVSGPIERSYSDNLLVVGDAARHTDPLTGGGMGNGMISGMIAGKIAGVKSQERKTSSRDLKEYEDKWKSEIGKTLERNLKIKEFLLELKDEELDAIAKVIKKKGIEELSVMGILAPVIREHPRLLFRIKDLL